MSTTHAAVPTPESTNPRPPHAAPPFTGTRLFFLHLGLHPTAPGARGAILTCKPDGSDLQPLLTNLGTHPDGLLVDCHLQHLYYSNMGADPSAPDGSICRVDLDGRNNIVLVPPPPDAGQAFTPKQIAIDRGCRKLYWCDREGGRVWRADTDGANVECLYVAGPRAEDWSTDEVNHCVGIGVDAERGAMFWTQKGPKHGGQGRLFRAGLDIPPGETASTRSDVRVLMDHLPEPIDLELDTEARVVYKTDRGAPPRGNTVSRLHLDRDEDGRMRVEEEVLVRGLHDAIGVAVDKRAGKMYFTDIGGSVYVADLDGGGVREILRDMGDLTGIWCAHFD